MIVVALRVSFSVGKMGEMGEGGYIACACELRGRGRDGGIWKERRLGIEGRGL